MKNLKKSLIFFTSLVALIALTACSGNKTSTNSASNGSEKSGLDKIKSSKKLQVGVKQDVPNFGFKDPETGKFSGMEIELAEMIAKDLGVEAVFTPVTAQTRGPLLDNNQIDIVAATFTITDERKLTYNFTEPYFTDEAGFLVKKKNNFKNIKDLDGKNIGVAQSSSTKTNLEKLADENGIKFQYTELSDYPSLKLSLTSGRTDAFAVDKSILSGYVDDQTEILDIGFAPQKYGVATKKSNTELDDYINQLIAKWKSDGTMNKLYDKYNLKDASQK
ncbi:transporter substrate-binding domain-containing protein [Floricoccus penangensis]|uniref:transporter substrate-binding domain-containing protein n=1 Tax=Floricoccus penangensis TaxID=1859475 RepID=UPI002041902F|nr:transporter substrate-binding domain-containing protein [Floricoccus penangensis]URZ87703.1 transporter substrate-binding domain-containing protein [Floricoccus penangensis]